MKPSCFIIMPFGKKMDAEGNTVDFDAVYHQLIQPSVIAANMEAVRADEETVNGIIHKPMYERLILSDYAVADLTTANANVFYELGIRHAVKPFTTITLFASGSKLPFDLNFLRCMPYDYDFEKKLTNAASNIKDLSKQLLSAKLDRKTDSPVYQLVDGIQFQNSVAHEKTDIFRDRVVYDEKLKEQLQSIRSKDLNNAEKTFLLEKLVDGLKPLEDVETGVLIDCMLTYRSLEAFNEMISFIGKLPVYVQQTVMVQEQFAFALNRTGTRESRQKAIAVLEKLIGEKGDSSETNGILGRVYKDLFTDAVKTGNEILASAYLDKALETYMKGFKADWRDAYPGINALMLIGLKGNLEEVNKLSPVVEFAVLRKMERKEPDYWDYASLLEIAVIRNDEADIQKYLLKALTASSYMWMKKTTINNLKLIKSYRQKRNGAVASIENVIKALQQE